MGIWRNWDMENQNKFDTQELRDLFTISTKSENPNTHQKQKYKHFSIPAFDKNKTPVIELGEQIKSNKYLLEKDSILVSKLNPRIKRVWRYKHFQNDEVPVCSTEFIVYQPKNNSINMEFYFHYFNSDIFQEYLLGLQSGTTGSRMRVTPKDTFKLKIPIPTMNEQKKIASIFSAVDGAIEKTELIIKQTERAKKGLMQQLLTKGIGHTKFKKTEMGEIPEEWKVRALGTIGTWSGGGTPSKQEPSYWSKDKQVIWVSPKDMYSNIITSSEDYITEKGLSEKKLKLLPKGTILFVTRSGILRNRVPIALAGDSLTINQDLKALQVASNIDYDFIFYTLLARNDSIRNSCVKTGTTVESIDFQALQEFLIPVPTLSEQKEIVKIISTYYKKLENEKSYLEYLGSLKKGLMQSLLTGKVCVTVGENEVTQV